MDNRPIGVFDSGLGGLTAVKEFARRMPDEDIIYFGDTGRVPYGTRSNETVTRYVRQDIRFLEKFDIKAIIIACGTASSVALPKIKEYFDVPIIGVVEGAARAAANVTKNKRIGVIGTDATVQSGAFDRAISEIDTGAEIVSKACPLFVPLVENGRIKRDDSVLRLIVEEYLGEIRGFGADTLILGCTHYPIISDAIGDFMGSDVTLINPGREAVETIIRLKCVEESGKKQGKTSFYVSDDKQSFGNVASLFLGRDINDSLKLINIDEF